MKTFGMLISLLLMAAVGAQAATTVRARLLNTAEQSGHLGADLVVIVKASDFTTTTTNTAETLTLDVDAGDGFAGIYADVITPFTVTDTNYTASLAMIVGDGDDDDQYIVSTQLASASTNAAGVFGTGVPAGLFYSAADTIDFKFTPNAEYATSTFTAGEVWIYVKLVD